MRGALRAERRKLLAQPATRVLVLACGLGPLLFAAILSGQSSVPGDTLLGGWVHSSGWAVSVVVLGFAGYLGFPILAGALAGDAFSSEDRYGTWKTLLTRSQGRRELFAGKLLAAWTLALVLLALAATSSIVGGLLFSGAHPIVGLSGQQLSSGEALWLVLAAWAFSAVPLLAFVTLALLCSAAFRNGIAGVLGPLLAGLAMQLLALTGNGSWMHPALLASSFDVWHGLFASPSFWDPLAIGLGVAVLWTAGCAVVCWGLLARRDFAGPPVTRRPGWLVPAQAIAAVAVVVVLLGLAGGLGPAAVTAARLEASIAPAFDRLTLLQQRELGRPAAAGAKLKLRTVCRRRSGHTVGPGDDWACTITVVEPRPGAEPFQLTPVTYDVSVKSDGCWKADAPPSFIGRQTMRDAAGRSVVNPLFTIYGCFDTTGRARRYPGTAAAAATPSQPAEGEQPGGHGETTLREIERLANEPSRGSSSGGATQSGAEAETEESRRALEQSGKPPGSR